MSAGCPTDSPQDKNQINEINGEKQRMSEFVMNQHAHSLFFSFVSMCVVDVFSAAY